MRHDNNQLKKIIKSVYSQELLQSAEPGSRIRFVVLAPVE
jgi:hypothetical protein